jgi:hypothetical protein
MHNLVEPVNKDLEFQLHEPFLLYRNASCEYICFHLLLSDFIFITLFLEFQITVQNTAYTLFYDYKQVSQSGFLSWL